MFAALINNKVAVYMPHLLIGFSLAAGVAVSEVAVLARRIDPRAAALTLAVFFAGYGVAATVYYEKWYSSAGKSELVSYERTDATLRTLVPAGSKYLFASPQFWTSFHAEPQTTFYSYAAAQPGGSPELAVLPAVGIDRPIFLVVDELQWLPELGSPISQSTTSWQQDWIAFIERHCALDGTALGTAHGTLALYRCALAGKPIGRPDRLVGGNVAYQLGARALSQTTEDLASWPRYDDPRRTAAGAATGSSGAAGSGDLGHRLARHRQDVQRDAGRTVPRACHDRADARRRSSLSRHLAAARGPVAWRRLVGGNPRPAGQGAVVSPRPRVRGHLVISPDRRVF